MAEVNIASRLTVIESTDFIGKDCPAQIHLFWGAKSMN